MVLAFPEPLQQKRLGFHVAQVESHPLRFSRVLWLNEVVVRSNINESFAKSFVNVVKDFQPYVDIANRSGVLEGRNVLLNITKG